jgi:hypothetical protein
MVLLLLAIIFNYTAHRKVVQSSGSSMNPAIMNPAMAAYISMGLWVGIIFCGIFIAFIN